MVLVAVHVSLMHPFGAPYIIGRVYLHLPLPLASALPLARSAFLSRAKFASKRSDSTGLARHSAMTGIRCQVLQRVRAIPLAVLCSEPSDPSPLGVAQERSASASNPPGPVSCADNLRLLFQLRVDISASSDGFGIRALSFVIDDASKLLNRPLICHALFERDCSWKASLGRQDARKLVEFLPESDIRPQKQNE
jgi:hypothetical protein